MAGDARMTQQLLNEMRKNEAKAEKEHAPKPVNDADREVVEALFVRIRHAARAGA
jgi:hypothetical protein